LTYALEKRWSPGPRGPLRIPYRKGNRGMVGKPLRFVRNREAWEKRNVTRIDSYASMRDAHRIARVHTRASALPHAITIFSVPINIIFIRRSQ
jgi:hypothetical protein